MAESTGGDRVSFAPGRRRRIGPAELRSQRRIRNLQAAILPLIDTTRPVPPGRRLFFLTRSPVPLRMP